MTEPGPLVVIVGETASGKSALAMELAERFNGELICADSWTVYRGFDIGTAKPTAADRAEVPHHLLDVADPAEGFNAVRFKQLATGVIDDITSRKRLPIMVGGTGLYIDSVLYDYQFPPATSPQLRAELNKLSIPELLEKIDKMGLDPQGIDTRNKRRIVRHIENEGVMPSRHPLRANTLILGLQVPREDLRQRASARVDAMLAAGLEREVRSLMRYGWDIEPMKGIGYREWQPYFEAEVTGFAGQNHDQTVSQVRERIIKGTMDLAKRQRTWFKRNDSIQWVPDRSNAVDIVTTFLNKSD